jgi:AcrR family transcriptional regulator
MAVQHNREEARDAFLDAAERLLTQMGWADITVRKLAAEAGLNHGLVHYYFGSMEEVLLQVLERFTDRLIARQRALYGGDMPFLEKWREAIGYLEEDRESGYQKIWYELQAMAWSRPALRERVAHVNDAWRGVLTDAISSAMTEYGLDQRKFPVEAMVALVVTFNEGIMLERLSGVTAGHKVLLESIDAWLQTLERDTRRKKS